MGSKRTLLAVFEADDTKGEGVIATKRLVSLLKAIGCNVDLKLSHLDENGEISYEELVEWLHCSQQDDPAAIVEDMQTKAARLKKEIDILEADLSNASTKGKRLKMKHAIRDKRKLLAATESERGPGSDSRLVGDMALRADSKKLASKPSLSERALSISARLTEIPGTPKILSEPDLTSLPDGSRLLHRFREVFESLQGNSDRGVTPQRLEEALNSFAKTLPKELCTRIKLVVANIFEAVDTSRDGVIQWEEFEQRVGVQSATDNRNEEAIATLFELCDADDDGVVSAEELMNVFLIVSQLLCAQGTGDSSAADLVQLTPDVAKAIVRDLDSSGTGGIEICDFAEIIRTVTTLDDRRSVSQTSDLPHLVLNFDVNNTVIMFDSATASDIDNVLSMIISNSAWGRVTYDSDGRADSWETASTELSPFSPATGLKTYSEYVREAIPLPEGTGGEDFKQIAHKRRTSAWNFTKPGEPGEAFRPKLDVMRQALLLPAAVKGTEKAMLAGLTGESVNLLPAFLNLLRELKRSGRSFTLMFRTFGNDLGGVEQELNAFCEGRHPYYSDDVVLDGSDGQPDYRMRLHSTEGCGTFYRDPEKDFISLAMGTIEQPTSIDDGLSFLGSLEVGNVVVGQEAVGNRYAELGALHCTIALRDFYPAWKQVNFQPNGGKPFFLNSINDPSLFAIFFDDHISPASPKIVDPINPRQHPRRYHSSQLFGLHLVQAQPLHSITNPDYFIQALQQCEAARQQRLERWKFTKRILEQLSDVHQFLNLLVGELSTTSLLQQGEHIAYVPWCDNVLVRSTSTAATFEEPDPSLQGLIHQQNKPTI